MSKDCDSGVMPCRLCYPHASGGLYKRALHSGMTCHLLCPSEGMLLTGSCPSSRHKPISTRPSGVSIDGYLSCGLPSCRFKVLDDLHGIELICKLQSLSFALAGRFGTAVLVCNTTTQPLRCCLLCISVLRLASLLSHHSSHLAAAA